jgi:hypothetical protein
MAEAWPGRVDGRDRVRFQGGGFGLLSNSPTAQEVDTPIVRNPEQPRRKRTLVVEGVQLPVRVKQRVLDDILAVERRSGHSRTVTMQAWPEVGNRFQERQVARLEGTGGVNVGTNLHNDVYAAGGPGDTCRANAACGEVAEAEKTRSWIESSRPEGRYGTVTLLRNSVSSTPRISCGP